MMKKLLTIIGLLVAGLFVQAQNYAVLHIEDVPAGESNMYYYCVAEYDGVEIYAQEGCPSFEWTVNYSTHYNNVDPLILDNNEESYYIHYAGCSLGRNLTIMFLESEVENPFPEPILWKRQGESITLYAESYGYSITWSTGETTNEIQVTEPGVYSVTIVDTEFAGCVNQTFFVEVRDNVEIESASVDPESNKNLVTWEVTPAQAEYISNVIVNRDGVDLVPVPYINGEYLDNIGSDLAARIYTITGVSVEGTPCPIPSLERGTIHMAFLPDINGNVEMTWNSPELGGANIHVGRFEICEYDPNTMEIAVIDFVNPSTMSYSCNQSMFNYGYPLIRAIIQDGRGEKDMLSNRTDELVGLGEVESKTFNVYPNPAQGCVTIEGTGTLTITNILGQTILTKEIDGKEIVELPQGLYFVKLGETTQKIVVE